jgi:hypothetical protein
VKTCPQCQATFLGRPKQQFCSRGCSASYSNARRGDCGPPPQTVCKRGHKFEGDNVYINKAGARNCRECRRLRDGSTSRKARKRPAPRPVAKLTVVQQPTVEQVAWRPNAPGWPAQPGVAS